MARVALPAKLGILLLPLFTSTTLAQSTIPQIVVFANQTPTDAQRVGSSVTVLKGETLREKQIPTVADALRTVPGVEVDQSGGRGSLSAVRIRGSETRQVLVLIDGIEVNQTGFPGFDFADLPTDDIERIEVIRGPQAGLYGANAHAGVISIVTRSGKGLTKPAVDARIEGGTNTTASAGINVRGATDSAYGSITASNYNTKGYNISRFGTEDDGSGAFVLSAKGGIDLTQNLNIEGVFRYTDRFTDTDPQSFSGPTAGYVIDGPGRSTYKSSAGRIGTTLKLFEDHWIQTANVKIFKEQTRSFSSTLNPTFGADGTRQTLDYKSTFLFDTKLFGGEHHSVSVLVDNRRENYNQLFSSTTYNKERTGLAGEYMIDLPTMTTLSGAWRHDWNNAFANIDTWRLSASQRFPTLTRLHTSIGKGVTDPDVFALFGSSFNLPNPGLTPEQSIGWDAGVEQKFWDGRAVVDVTYFQSDFTNKIELTFDTTRGGFVYVNGIGAAHRRGVETSATVEVAYWLTVNATYTYTDATNSLGVQEIRRPPHSGSIETTARFLDNKARATVGVTYNSVRKDTAFLSTGTTTVDLPATAIVRAALSYDVTPWSTAFLRVENVFNTQYEEVFSYRAPGFGAYVGMKARLGG